MMFAAAGSGSLPLSGVVVDPTYQGMASFEVAKQTLIVGPEVTSV